MSQPVIKYQSHKFVVQSSGDEMVIDFDTDKRYKCVTGINIIFTDGNAGFSEIQLDIGSEEISPDNFEVARLERIPFVPLDYQYKTIKAEAGGSKVKGKYKDVDFTGTNYPYTVIISLRLENCSV